MPACAPRAAASSFTAETTPDSQVERASPIRAEAAATATAGIPCASSTGEAHDSGSSARVIERGPARTNPQAVPRAAGKRPAVGAGDHDALRVFGTDERGGVAADHRGPAAGGGTQDEPRLLPGRRLRWNVGHGPGGHPPHRRRTVLPRRAAEGARWLVAVADAAARVHVLAVSDPGGVVGHRGGRNAERGEIAERCDAGLVATDRRVIQDHAEDPGPRREVAAVTTAVGAGDHHPAPMFRARGRDAVEKDRGDYHARVRAAEAGRR